MHGEREVCIWKRWSMHGERVCAYGRGRVCMDEERNDHVYGRGGVCVHANSVQNYLTLSFLFRFVSGSQDYAYPNFRGHNMNFARQHQLTY